MIGGQDDDIAGLQPPVEIGQPCVEGFEGCGITGNIAAMAEKHVEIDEVGEDEIAVLGLVDCGKARIEQRHVAVGLGQFRHALMGEDIADLADRVHRAAGMREPVKNRRLRRQNRVVAPVAGSNKGLWALPDEGAGDDPADIVVVDETANDLAELQQALQPEGVLVCGDLKDAVGRGVADRFARAHMLLAEARDDVGAGGVAIAENAGDIALAADRLHELGGKRVALGREIAPVEHDRRTCNFPMARRRILAARDFAGSAVGAVDPARHRHAHRHPPRCQFRRVHEPECRHIGKMQRPFAQACTICSSGRAEFGDVAKRVRAQVAIGFSIRRTAYAEGIEDKEKRARHERSGKPERGAKPTVRCCNERGSRCCRRNPEGIAPAKSHCNWVRLCPDQQSGHFMISAWRERK